MSSIALLDGSMYYRTAPRIEPGKGVIRRHWYVVVVGLGLERCVVGMGGM